MRTRRGVASTGTSRLCPRSARCRHGAPPFRKGEPKPIEREPPGSRQLRNLRALATGPEGRTFVAHSLPKSTVIAGNPRVSLRPGSRIDSGNPRFSHCLPCRRSWVRVPSAASSRARSPSGFLRVVRSLVRLILGGTLDSEWTVARHRSSLASREPAYLQALFDEPNHRLSASPSDAVQP